MIWLQINIEKKITFTCIANNKKGFMNFEKLYSLIQKNILITINTFFGLQWLKIFDGGCNIKHSVTRKNHDKKWENHICKIWITIWRFLIKFISLRQVNNMYKSPSLIF